jgi:hypothetical protein
MVMERAPKNNQENKKQQDFEVVKETDYGPILKKKKTIDSDNSEFVKVGSNGPGRPILVRKDYGHLYKDVPVNDSGYEDDVNDYELTPEEIEEFEKAQKELGIDENEPNDLTPEQQKDLKGVLHNIARNNYSVKKYIRSGIAAIALTGALGSEKTNEEDSSPVARPAYTESQNELDINNEVITEKINQEDFSKEVSDRLRNPEKFMSEFDKKVQEVASLITVYDVTKTKEYADKRVVGAEDYTRAEYVAKAIKFTPWNEETGEGIPKIVEDELRRLLPGLCAQESRYDASRVSKVGARGILQIMPDNWKRYGGKPGDETSLVAQVEVACKLLSAMYQQLQDRLGDEVISELKEHFPNEEAFQKDLMVPVLINSYNAGDGRLARAVVSYLHDTMPENRPRGKDLFTDISAYAYENQSGLLRGFKSHSKNYPYQVEALAYHFDINNKDKPNKG